MTFAVALAVLFAALCHASWNAIVRLGGDKIISVTLLVTAAGIIAAPAILLFPPLPRAAWPYLIASVAIHLGYNAALAMSYHHGELTRVYPLLRGSAPLTTLAISLLLLDEAVEPGEIAGIVVLAAGIIALTLEGGWRVLARSPHAVLYAAASSICITGYTIADGLGARVADSPHQYAAWFFLLDMLPMLAGVLLVKRREFAAALRVSWPAGLAGGALSLVAYWIVIWAMTVAPIPLVAALRETSILFALLIGMVWLGEKVTPVRAASIALVLAGLALMRF